jgi:hypothetical protein
MYDTGRKLFRAKFALAAAGGAEGGAEGQAREGASGTAVARKI